MRGYIVAAVILAVLLIVGAFVAVRLDAQYTEGAAQAQVYTDCLLATDANTALCQTSKVFETYRAEIIACYRADRNTYAFRACLDSKGIRNPA